MSRPNAIQKLSPLVIGKIAAGEVIERPASVVKELLENALDAGARQVSIEIGRGGLDLIRIADDGCGIAPDDLPLAFERHATSKLVSDSDLDSVSTLGFRGEALPSIAAVADVELLSRPADAAAGRFVSLRDGEVTDSGDKGAPPGTSVSVRHLFSRQPARLKFLRSPAAEAAQIAAVVSHYALAYPKVRFTLLTDGRLTLRTPGSGDLLDAAAGVYGHQVARSLLPLSAASSRSVLPAFDGLIGEPDVSRANRNYITLFINRRWVRNRALTYAIEEAYQGFLMTGRHPLAVVDIRLAPTDVDVNVHPSKLEVRLRNEREVFALLQREVRRTLTQRSPQPAVAGTTAWQGRSRVSLPDTRPEPAPPPPETTSAAPPAEQPLLAPSLPVLRPLGQVGSVYVVAEGPEGLYLVDQHAAHERILFERFLKAGAAPDAQGLLEPVAVDLAPRQQALVEEMAQELSEQGFSLEPFGERSFLVRSVPAAFADADVAAALVEFLDALAREEAAPDRRRRVAMSLACHSAIRAGQSLSAEEMRELLRQLEQTENPRHCPHGRPTMVHLSADDLAREFRRR